MKKLLALLLLVPSLALADAPAYKRNQGLAADINTQDLEPGSAAVDSAGRVYMAAEAGGDAPLKAEDTAHSSGAYGMMCLGVANADLGSNFAASGDYTPIATTIAGAVYTVNKYDSGTTNAQQLLKPEDTAAGDAHAGILPFSVREDALTVNTTTSGDYTYTKADKFGRQLVMPAPDGVWFKCNSAADIVDTTSTAVCAADGDEIYNIQTITCSNTDATVETRVDILDGATVVWQMTLGAADSSDQTETITFPTPLKMAATNTAINAQPATTSAQIRCSIAGFKTPS